MKPLKISGKHQLAEKWTRTLLVSPLINEKRSEFESNH